MEHYLDIPFKVFRKAISIQKSISFPSAFILGHCILKKQIFNFILKCVFHILHSLPCEYLCSKFTPLKKMPYLVQNTGRSENNLYFKEIKEMDYRIYL